MRLYGGRILKNRVTRAINLRTETRDAVIYDVLPDSRMARVKIQGSNELIVCYYPENWEQTPVWLKAGNVARITHTGGNRGRLELTGHGILIPTPIAGGSGAPVPPTIGDTILTGLGLHAALPTADMTVSVDAGTYRIDGTIYSLISLVMDRTDIVMDRPDLVMGEVSAVVTFAAAHATLFRYDRIVAGIDGVAEVVQGDNFPYTSPGSIPDTPADHVSLGWVLIYPNMTQITQTDINRMFTTPIAAELRIVIEDDELAWNDLTTTLTISIRDQYGNLFPRSGEGYYVTIQWILGNGELTEGGVTQASPVSLSFYMASTASVTYERDNEVTDESPSFYVTESVTGFPMTASITLLDEDDYPMT